MLFFSSLQEDQSVSGNVQDSEEIVSHWLRIKFQAVKENSLLQKDLSTDQ